MLDGNERRQPLAEIFSFTVFPSKRGVMVETIVRLGGAQTEAHSALIVKLVYCRFYPMGSYTPAIWPTNIYRSPIDSRRMPKQAECKVEYQ